MKISLALAGLVCAASVSCVSRTSNSAQKDLRLVPPQAQLERKLIHYHPHPRATDPDGNRYVCPFIVQYQESVLPDDLNDVYSVLLQAIDNQKKRLSNEENNRSWSIRAIQNESVASSPALSFGEMVDYAVEQLKLFDGGDDSESRISQIYEKVNTIVNVERNVRAKKKQKVLTFVQSMLPNRSGRVNETLDQLQKYFKSVEKNTAQSAKSSLASLAKIQRYSYMITLLEQERDQLNASPEYQVVSVPYDDVFAETSRFIEEFQEHKATARVRNQTSGTPQDVRCVPFGALTPNQAIQQLKQMETEIRNVSRAGGL